MVQVFLLHECNTWCMSISRWLLCGYRMHHFCRSGITARDGAFASRYPTEVKEYCCENDNVTFSSSFGFSVSPAATYTLCEILSKSLKFTALGLLLLFIRSVVLLAIAHLNKPQEFLWYLIKAMLKIKYSECFLLRAIHISRFHHFLQMQEKAYFLTSWITQVNGLP